MKRLFRIPLPSIARPLAVAMMIVGLARFAEAEFEDGLIQVAPAPAAAAVDVAVPILTVAPVEEAKAAKPDPKRKETSRLLRQDQPILFPTIYPNPLAFNITWFAITRKTFAEAKALALRQKAVARRAAVLRRPPANVAAKNAMQQQVRKLLEPMLTTELSFAARTTALNRDERKKLLADGKVWFEKFLVQYVDKLDPNQQEMLMQGMQGIWFGNQQQKPENPREALRTGLTQLVKDTLSTEKATAYANECRKRGEFERQVSVDNLVERIDEKVKLSPDQWKNITKTLSEHWDKRRDPQLEAFALNQSMWPGAPTQLVLPLLSPAQRTVLTRINAGSGQMFINGGVFGQMFGGVEAVFNDMDVDTNVEVVEPAEPAAPMDAEAE